MALRSDLHCNKKWMQIIDRAKDDGCIIDRLEIYDILHSIAGPLMKGIVVPVKPVAIIMCGPVGAGKTTIKGNILEELGIKQDDTIFAEPDAILATLKQWMNPATKLKCQKTSGQILYKFLLEYLAATRHHIVYDTTCRAIGNTMDAIEYFARNGYYVVLAEIYVSLSTSQARVRGRYNAATEKNKRYIDPKEVEYIYREFSKKASAYFEKKIDGKPVRINELRLYNNEGNVPALLYKRVNDKVDMMINGKFYYDYKKFIGGSTRRRCKGSVCDKRVYRSLRRR